MSTSINHPVLYRQCSFNSEENHPHVQFPSRAISDSKTTMTIAKVLLCCKLMVKNTCTEQVMRFEYLVCRITSSGTVVGGHPRQPIWNNKHISLSCKSRIHKTCMWPIMRYGAKTRAVTLGSKKFLRLPKCKLLGLL